MRMGTGRGNTLASGLVPRLSVGTDQTNQKRGEACEWSSGVGEGQEEIIFPVADSVL